MLGEMLAAMSAAIAADQANDRALAEQQKACRSKRQYHRENDALMAVARACGQGRLGTGRVFRCGVCRAWHIATSLPRAT